MRHVPTVAQTFEEACARQNAETCEQNRAREYGIDAETVGELATLRELLTPEQWERFRNAWAAA